MSSMQCLHWLLFSICLILSITPSASSTIRPSIPVQNAPQKRTESGGSNIATATISTSLPQESTVTMEISTSTIQADDTTTEVSPSSAQGITMTMSTPSPTQDYSTDMATTNSTIIATTNSTDMATTLQPRTTQDGQTPGLTTTANFPTSQTKLTPFSSTSVPTGQSAEPTVTATSASVSRETIHATTVLKTQEPPLGLSHSEVSLTTFFGVVLGLTVLAVAGYGVLRCKQKRSQYIHQPLFNSPEETGDRFSAPGDTLVISGGLYDGPEIFNPTMTADEDMEFHSDQPPFAPQPTEFRLEFLSDEQPKSPDHGGPTFETFQPFDLKD